MLMQSGSKLKSRMFRPYGGAGTRYCHQIGPRKQGFHFREPIMMMELDI